MKVLKEFLKPVLEKLYSIYPSFLDVKELKRDVMKKQTYEVIKSVCFYLTDKGLIIEGPSGPECPERRWRISAFGIDLLEGKSLIQS